MKKKLIAISLAAIVVVSFAAAMPTALGSDDVNLTVTRIDPKYVFGGLDNVIIGYVNNTGTTGATTGSVSLVVTNAVGNVVYSEKNTSNLPIAPGQIVEVEFQWKPTALEDVTLNVTADCDNDVVETNEGDNSLVDQRTTTGDCLVDTMLAEECYGYRGQHPMGTVIEGSGSRNLIYTTGNYKYQSGWYGGKNYSVNFNIGPTGDTNRIVNTVTYIPEGATIKMARLYLYYCWYPFDGYDWKYPSEFWDMTFVKGSTCDPTAQPVAEAANYTDYKGFTASYTYKMYGTIAYDVTGEVTGNSDYCAYLINNEPGLTTKPKGTSFSGMALLIVYEDESVPYIKYSIDEGCDRVATRYWYWNNKTARDYKRWHYYVKPENTTASFPCVDNPPEEIVKTTLFTATVDPNADQETLYFNNGGPWTGVWSGSYYYPLGTDSRDVQDELQSNPACENEIAKFQERYTTKNGFSATNAILIVEKLLPADVTIEPETLNLKSNGQWITAYIELPVGNNVADIDVNTTRLDCEIWAENDTKYGFVSDPNSYLVDHDGDGIQERLVKFDRTAVIEYLETIDYVSDTGNDEIVELYVSGELYDGTPFKGRDTISVMG